MLLRSTSQTQEHRIVSTIEKAERLKKELTDKWVVVAANAPELKRFANLTGKVKTVNMSCRALVEFDGPVDIGWYDIDTSYLTVVDAPQPKKAAAHAEAKPVATAAPAAKAAPATGGGSPLDKIRAAAKPTAAAAPAPEAAVAPIAPEEAPKPGVPKPAAPMSGSPMDRIRAMGAAKKE